MPIKLIFYGLYVSYWELIKIIMKNYIEGTRSSMFGVRNPRRRGSRRTTKRIPAKDPRNIRSSIQKVPGKEPSHPIRRGRDTSGLGGQPAQQVGLHREDHAAAHREVELAQGRGQEPLPTTRVPLERRHGPSERLHTVLRARFQAVPLARQADARAVRAL